MPTIQEYGLLIITDSLPYFFSKFNNPLNTDTPLIWTLSTAPSMPVLMGFDCTVKSSLMDTCLIRTPLYYGQLASLLGKESGYIFFIFSKLTGL